MLLTGLESTAMTVPVALTPRSNDGTSLPMSVAAVDRRRRRPEDRGLGIEGGFAGVPAPSATAAAKVSASWALSCSRAAVTSASLTCGNSSRAPPLVAALLRTESVVGSSAAGMTVMVFGSTLPDGPGLTAVTDTFASVGMT